MGRPKGTVTVIESRRTAQAKHSDLDIPAQHRPSGPLRLADVQDLVAPLLSGKVKPDSVKQEIIQGLETIARRYSLASVAEELKDVAMHSSGADGNGRTAGKQSVFDLAATFYSKVFRETEAISGAQRTRLSEAPRILSDLLTCYFLSGRGIEGIEYCLDAAEGMVEDSLLAGAAGTRPNPSVVEKTAVSIVDTVVLEVELESTSPKSGTTPKTLPATDAKIIGFLISWREGVRRCARDMSSLGLAVSPAAGSPSQPKEEAIQRIERLATLARTAVAAGCPSIAGLCFERAAVSAVEYGAEGISNACRYQAVLQFDSAAKMYSAVGLSGRARTATGRARKLAGHLDRPRPRATTTGPVRTGETI